MQNHRSPSFLHISTMALHQGLWLGWTVLTSSISFMCAWTSSNMGGGILQNLSLKGSSSVTLILCLARSVQPNSPGSKEKMVWYAASRELAATWSLPDHPSMPDKSSCWKSSSFLCSTAILISQIPCISCTFSKVPGTTSIRGTTFTSTPWVTLTPLAMVIAVVVRFFTTTAVYLLPVVNSV